MDFDNDGVQDFISGSYDPGDIWLFRGRKTPGSVAAAKSGGSLSSLYENLWGSETPTASDAFYFDEGIVLRDETDTSLVHHPVEFRSYQEIDEDKKFENEATMLRIASFGSWPSVVDWDDDGDLDLLIGTFSGNMYLRTNIGTRAAPVFSKDAIQVEADSKPLNVKMHAAPNVADWDGDGLWDLIVGSGDGAVGWYRNVGMKNSPQLEAYRPLILPASDTKFLEQNLDPGDVATHGARAQICVVDYNNDGRLDLLVGDYSNVNWLKELTEEELVEQKRVTDQLQQLAAESQALQKKYADDWENEQFQSAMQEFSQKYMKIDEKRKAFFRESRVASFVWVFLRSSSLGDAPWPTGTDLSESEDSVGVNTSQSERASGSLADNDLTRTAQLTLRSSVVPVAGKPGVYDVLANVRIEKGWHLYEHAPVGGAHTPTTLELRLPNGSEVIGETLRPAGLPSRSSREERVWRGSVTLTQRFHIPADSVDQTMQVVVNYEVCNKDYCLPVSRLTQRLSVSD